MGQCYGKTNPSPENDTATVIAVSGQLSSAAAASNGLPSVKNTPALSSAAASPWPSAYPHGGGGVSPSPARGTPTTRRILRRPFPPPSLAKHIRASLAKRLGQAKTKEGPIAEEEQDEEQVPDKSFGYSKNFWAKYELGKEVGRGHFGHTCYARGKKGELKDQPVAVKIISKAKVL